MAEPWFDPRGLLPGRARDRGARLPLDEGAPGDADPARPDRRGVRGRGAPRPAQGLGLGKALTLTGLHHLRGLGLPEVLLYVDADNTAAIALYEKLGFARHTLDVMYDADRQSDAPTRFVGLRRAQLTAGSR